MTVWAVHEFILTGKILSQDDTCALFETLTGRVIKLRGIARNICEDALDNQLNLEQALQRTPLIGEQQDALKDHLLSCNIFGPPNTTGRITRILKRLMLGRVELPLFPETLVQLVCSWIHRWRIALFSMTLMAAIGGLSYWLHLGGTPRLGGLTQPMQVFIFILINTYLHEIGHAYALHYFGEKPGVIGLRVYGPILAAYTDVNRAWMLSPRQRALVSIAGVSVQSLVTPFLTAIITWKLGMDNANFFMAITLMTMAYMALPMRENDGDWFLKDTIAGMVDSIYRTMLIWLRRVVSAASLLLFAYFITNGWAYVTATLTDQWKNLAFDYQNFMYFMTFAFVLLGTWSFINIIRKSALEALEFIKTRFRGNQKTQDNSEA